MDKIRTIIVDDEHHARQELKVSLEKYCPEIKIEAICDDPELALDVIQKLKPDLVFLDIQMPTMSGFDLLRRLMPVTFEVIFITAFDRYAIKAIKFSALDYLLKPLDIDDLKHAIDRVKAQRQKTGGSFRFQSVLNNIHSDKGRIEKLAVPSSDGITFFNTEDIIYCKADGHYTTLYLTNKRHELITRNLKDLEIMLINSGFCRVHNSYLINIKHVQKYIRGEGGYVILTEGYHADISRRKKDEFLRILDKV